jgi:micrococcal nuclease
MTNTKTAVVGLYQYKATLIRVVDSDTLILLVNLGFKVHKEVTVRLARINAPETSTLEGKTSKAFLESLLSNQQEVLLISNKLDSYGRSIGEVTLKDNTNNFTINLSDYLVDSKIAVYRDYK